MRVLRFVVEYLLGFLALIVFSSYAFADGPPTALRWQHAFLLGGAVGMAELGILLTRKTPANRLILGANLWLLAGAAAVLFEQWWWLHGYERLGESSLILAILIVGAVTTCASRHGFVGTVGAHRDVRVASVGLIVGVMLALGAALHFQGNVRHAAILPLIALAWWHRLLKHWVARRHGATEAAT